MRHQMLFCAIAAVAIPAFAATAVPAAYRYFGTGDIGGSGTPTGVRFINEAMHNLGPAYNAKLRFQTTGTSYCSPQPLISNSK